MYFDLSKIINFIIKKNLTIKKNPKLKLLD